MKRLLLASMASAMLCGGAIGAEQKPSFVEVEVATLNSAAARCGIAESSLKSTATLTLKREGIAIDPSTTRSTASLYIRPKVLVLADRSCVASMWVKVSVGLNRAKLDSVLEAEQFKPRQDIDLTLCDEDILLAGHATSMGQRANDAVENTIKVCLGKLAY
ncbi:MAG: hypothetical protein EPO27_01015 [Betaproteobacteria bacterium]|nr:MAG: hypothetical protein EPO27_01015 [Betaproteobacteria bacterium]